MYPDSSLSRMDSGLRMGKQFGSTVKGASTCTLASDPTCPAKLLQSTLATATPDVLSESWVLSKTLKTRFSHSSISSNCFFQELKCPLGILLLRLSEATGDVPPHILLQFQCQELVSCVSISCGSSSLDIPFLAGFSHQDANIIHHFYPPQWLLSSYLGLRTSTCNNEHFRWKGVLCHSVCLYTCWKQREGREGEGIVHTLSWML